MPLASIGKHDPAERHPQAFQQAALTGRAPRSPAPHAFGWAGGLGLPQGGALAERREPLSVNEILPACPCLFLGVRCTGNQFGNPRSRIRGTSARPR